MAPIPSQPRKSYIYLSCPRCGTTVRRNAVPVNGSIVCPECTSAGVQVTMRFPFPVMLPDPPE